MLPLKFLRLFIFCILFMNCGQKNNSTPKAKSNSSNAADSSRKTNNSNSSQTTAWDTNIDTVYKIQIDGKECQLLFTHEFPSPTGNLTTTIRIIESVNRDTLFAKTLDFNTVGEIEQPSPNHYWFTLEDYGGGSGYSGTLFNVRTTPTILLQPIIGINELLSWKSNRFASELIFCQGIWNMVGDGDNFESHFDKHKQDIGIIKIQPDTILIHEIGITRRKHDFFDSKDELQEFKRTEPALAKKINWTDYE